MREILVAAGSGIRGANTFDRAVGYYEFITSALGWNDIGRYLAGGCKGGPGKHQIDEKHLAGAYLLGRMLG